MVVGDQARGCGPPPRPSQPWKQNRRWARPSRLTWNRLRALGAEAGGAGDVPGRIPPGYGGAGGDAWRCRRRPHPENWVGGLAGPDLPRRRHTLRPRRRGLVPGGPPGSWRGAKRRGGAGFMDLEASTPPFSIMRHDHFGYRDRLLAAGHRGAREMSRPRDQARRSNRENCSRMHPDENGPAASAPARGPLPQRQFHGLPPPRGACGQVPRLPARAWPDS